MYRWQVGDAGSKARASTAYAIGVRPFTVEESVRLPGPPGRWPGWPSD
ncbi:hypothetical protein [Actinoplanes sp. CA-252034]